MNFEKCLRTPLLQDTSQFKLSILNRFVHLINIVSTLYLMSRDVDFVFSDP